MTRCDVEGVPLVIQRLRYNSSNCAWEVELFNGKEVHVSSDAVNPSVGLMQHRPTEFQRFAAYHTISNMVLRML